MKTNALDINSIFSSPKIRHEDAVRLIWLWSALIFWAVSYLPPFWMADISLNLSDEPYQILNSADCTNAPYSPLFYGLMTWVSKLHPLGLLQCRYIGLACWMGAILIGCLYYIHLTGKLLQGILLCGILNLVYGVAKASMHQIYGWDAPGALAMTISAITLLEYASRPKFGNALLCGFAVAVSLLVRISDAPLLLIFPTVWAAKSFHNRHWTNLIGYILVVSLTVWLVLTAFYGSIPSYMDSLASNTLGDHSFGPMLKDLLLGWIKPYVLMTLIISLILGLCLNSRLNKLIKFSTAIVCFAILVWKFCLNGIGSYLYLTITIFFAIVLVNLFFCKPDKRKAMMLRMGIIVAVGIIAFCGSNIGWLKFPALPLMPLAIAFFPLQSKGCMDRSVKGLLIFLFLFTVAIGLHASLTRNTFLDAPLPELVAEVKMPDGDVIKTTPEKAVSVNHFIELLPKLQVAPYPLAVIGVSNDRFFYEWICGNRNHLTRHFWALDSKTGTELLLQQVPSLAQQIVILVKRKSNRYECALVNKLLLTHHTFEDTEQWSIFTPK